VPTLPPPPPVSHRRCPWAAVAVWSLSPEAGQEDTDGPPPLHWHRPKPVKEVTARSRFKRTPLFGVTPSPNLSVAGEIHRRFASKYFTLLCIFLYTLLLIVYHSQSISSTTSSIAPEEARTATILDSKRRCENVFNLKLHGYIWCDVVYGCDVVNECDVINIVILYGFACLNECVRFRYVDWCTVYYVDLLYMFCNFFCVGYTVFCNFLTHANLRWLGLDPRWLAYIIYDG
jgi:hypothetical protein